MGSAYNRVPAGATAFAHRDERFLVEYVSAHADWTHAKWTGLHEHASGRN